jgi:hypothetical protein
MYFSSRISLGIIQRKLSIKSFIRLNLLTSSSKSELLDHRHLNTPELKIYNQKSLLKKN